MTGERWQEIKNVLEAVLQMDSEKRPAFLDQACASDQSLRREVESLLAADKQAQTNFLECPPLATRLEKGTRLGDYEIQSLLGAGGMGEVYRARDLRLRRDVAVKVLPAVVSSDPERLRRFEQEATAAAALNHPNILAVHQLGTYAGAPYLVSELLEGETLREQIRRGRIAPRRAIDHGVQIAHGLAAAHEKGIVHRDLKPENLFLTKDGRVKILDFGLAKLTQAQPRSEPSAPTIGGETEPGLIMGTVGYMSPEQVRGQAADFRADIFALGAILYEMLTGKRAFQKPTCPEIMNAILNEDPPPMPSAAPRLSHSLQRIVHRCLEKNPEQRFQSASDLAFALEALSDSGSSLSSGRNPTETAIGTSVRRKWILAIAGASVLALLTVVIMNVAGWRSRFFHHSGSPTIQSLAVLPLENLTGDASQEYFSDGMTDELITELSKLSALKVISRTSVMQYKGTKKTLPQISRELGVDGIIEGSVAREGEQVRITVQLLDGPNDRHLWADTYQRELRGILTLQSELARAIASQINIHVSPEERGRLTSAQFVNPAAHEAYLKAQSYFNQQTEEAFRKGLQALEQSVTIDPNYALGYAGLSQAYVDAGNGSHTPASEAYPKAKAAALKALQLDENLSDAHLALAYVRHYYDWDFTGAEVEYKRALELSPSDAKLHASYGYFLCRMGRSQQAISEARRALELDPVSLDVSEELGVVLHYSRRYDEAMARYKQLLESFPNSYGSRYQLARLYVAERKYEDAAREVKQLENTYGRTDMLRSFLAVAYAFSGKKSEAMAILDELKNKQKREFVRPYLIAEIYIGLGEKQQALDWLEKAYEERDDWVVWFKCDPIPDGLRSEPRFQELMRRIGFPS